METLVKRERAGYYGDVDKGLTKKVSKKKVKVNIIATLTFLGVFVFSFFFYTWAHVQVVHLNYEIAKAKTLESEYLEINRKLKTEAATLKAPMRIKQLAKNSLGLLNPQKEQVIVVK